VVQAGSFSGAARKRAITPSAVVRQIDTLEADLGLALLIRSTRALTLTDAGERLHERALRLRDDLADTHAEVSAFGGSVSGTLRIGCLPTFREALCPATPRVTSSPAPCPKTRVGARGKAFRSGA
jgi:DNA-binding transcriptional LysR family regulator